MSYLTVNGICAGYGKQSVVENISFQMESGCLLGIIGANGSGKTTLLKALCGILPHRGTCTLDNTVLEELSAKQLAHLVSYIPQRSGIAIDISALDVVLMGFNPQLKLLEHPAKGMVDSAMDALARVGLEGKEYKNYLHLSEGQKQLCILARTIVSGCRLLLLDEPESALDFRFRYQMLDMIRNLTDSAGSGAIITLHDPMLALNYCDKLLLLKNGKILDLLSPKEDSMEKLELALNEVYGRISLQKCTTRSGKQVITMLKEDEP